MSYTSPKQVEIYHTYVNRFFITNGIHRNNKYKFIFTKNTCICTLWMLGHPLSRKESEKEIQEWISMPSKPKASYLVGISICIYTPWIKTNIDLSAADSNLLSIIPSLNLTQWKCSQNSKKRKERNPTISNRGWQKPNNEYNLINVLFSFFVYQLVWALLV